MSKQIDPYYDHSSTTLDIESSAIYCAVAHIAHVPRRTEILDIPIIQDDDAGESKSVQAETFLDPTETSLAMTFIFPHLQHREGNCLFCLEAFFSPQMEYFKT